MNSNWVCSVWDWEVQDHKVGTWRGSSCCVIPWPRGKERREGEKGIKFTILEGTHSHNNGIDSLMGVDPRGLITPLCPTSQNDGGLSFQRTLLGGHMQTIVYWNCQNSWYILDGRALLHVFTEVCSCFVLSLCDLFDEQKLFMMASLRFYG